MMKIAAIAFALAATMLMPVGSASPEARAAEPADAVPLLDEDVQAASEVIILHGTNSGKGIDPEIGDLPQLKEPPFSSYDSYALLERADEKLVGEQTSSRKLPNGGKLEVTLRGVEEGKKGKRYSLEAAIKDAKGKDLLPSVKWNAKKGEYVFLAGPKYKKGILVIGIRISK
jgi:hypothetical protein